MQNARTILQQFYDAVCRRDMTKARSYLADDMVFVGLFETYPNADAYLSTFTKLMQIVTRLDIKTIIGNGNEATVFMEMETTAPVPATTLVAEWHEIENGKIVRARSAFDGRPFAAMFGGSECSILHRVGIDAKPETVLASLATIDGVRRWWVSTAKGNAAKGGTIDFGFCDMQVLEADASCVHWRCTRGPEEWLGSDVIFRLEWKDNQTYVLFEHAKWKKPTPFMHHCSTKWGTFLLSLRDAIEHNTGKPSPNDLGIHVGDRP